MTVFYTWFGALLFGVMLCPRVCLDHEVEQGDRILNRRANRVVGPRSPSCTYSLFLHTDNEILPSMNANEERRVRRAVGIGDHIDIQQ